jgi:hypothetical protein
MPAQPPFKPGDSYNTPLSSLEEMLFRGWAQNNNVPFNVNAPQSDYDMRGFWGALQQQNPKAQTAINQNDGRLHFPDYWKTPLHQTFSRESQWAAPNGSQWINKSQLANPSGRVVFDELNPQGFGLLSDLAKLYPPDNSPAMRTLDDPFGSGILGRLRGQQ